MAGSSPTTKLFQRRLYSFVSSKWGLPLCVVGVLLLLISVFQFGELFLQWSSDRYAAQFSIHHDNIAGKSFEKYITPELPIDIVYTWVNGSDPKLVKALKQLKDTLFKNVQEKDTKIKKNDTMADTKNSTLKPCPFTNCIQWWMIILDSTNLSQSLTIADCQEMFPRQLNHHNNIELFRFNSSSIHTTPTYGHATPTYGLRLGSDDDVTNILINNNNQLISNKGINITITRGYLTSDSTLLSAVSVPLFYMILCPSLLINNSLLINSLRNHLQILTNKNIEEFTVTTNGVGVIRLKGGNWTSNNTLSYRNYTFSIIPAHAIWLPFKLPNNDNNNNNANDPFGANRFQDNEELRYSLRSVQQYAPWVRRIHIVTNGQIPHWLDLDNPRISIVTHEDIFPNTSHLPSYSSPAIESHLHRIPGLSKWFLYLNDDVMFGQEVWPHDFFTPDGGQKVYLSWSVPNCADGCPPNWIHDNYCDTACNTSVCNWDGGDCANATRPGPVGGHGYSWSNSNTDYCNAGCMTNWIGDRYCDSSCNTGLCGYDAGDCGLDNFHRLYHIKLTTNNNNNTFIIPLETIAMFVNLSMIFPNESTIVSADHTPCDTIRSAAISSIYRTLSVTFYTNKNVSSANFTITGKHNNQTITIEFQIIIDTINKNSSLYNALSVNGWSFTNYNNSSDPKFLHEVTVKLQNSNKSVNYWITEKPHPSLTPPTLDSTLINYTISNISLLPPSVAMGYRTLRNELDTGLITIRGYLRRLDHLMADCCPNIPQQEVIMNDTINIKTNDNKRGVVSSDTDPVSTESTAGGMGAGGHLQLLRGNNNGGMRKLLEQSHHWLPWERLNVFPNLPLHSSHEEVHYDTPNRRGRHLLDTFGDSLKHVNNLYNKAYGHKPRKVPAHMPHMINKEIMEELQNKYPIEFDQTSSHQLRSSSDMQYSFAYFYYVIGETIDVNIEQVFMRLDTDQSGILSVRELRTLIVKVFNIPLTKDDVESFESTLNNCRRSYKGTPPSIDPIEYETNYDPDLPLVTLDFVMNCSELMKQIKTVYGTTPKYRHEEMGEEHVAFKMLHENSSRILLKLDEVRRDQRKFICLNDNMDHSRKESRMAQLLLRDFYDSLFPISSQFELPPFYRNKFLYTSELQEWLKTRWRLKYIIYFLLVVLLIMCFGSLFYGKVIQLKRRILKLFSLFYQRTKSHRIFTV